MFLLGFTSSYNTQGKEKHFFPPQPGLAWPQAHPWGGVRVWPKHGVQPAKAQVGQKARTVSGKAHSGRRQGPGGGAPFFYKKEILSLPLLFFA